MEITDIIITTTNGNNVKYNKSDIVDLELAYKNIMKSFHSDEIEYIKVTTDDRKIETILAIKHIVGVDVIRS